MSINKILKCFQQYPIQYFFLKGVDKLSSNHHLSKLWGLNINFMIDRIIKVICFFNLALTNKMCIPTYI